MLYLSESKGENMSIRLKEELENVIKVLKAQRVRLPEFSVFGDENWKNIDDQLYYVEYTLNHGTVPSFEESDEGAEECYEWLNGEDRGEYYEDILEELAELG